MSIDFKISYSNKLEEIAIISPSISTDERGTIWTSYLRDQLDSLIPDHLYFKHEKFSESKNNVLRGIHGDDKSWKLVTSVYGQIEQVVVDCRKTSGSYGQWDKFIITNNNQLLILIPPGFGNAYYVMSDKAVYHYKLAYEGGYNDVENQFTYPWNEPDFKINWSADRPILSSRDNL